MTRATPRKPRRATSDRDASGWAVLVACAIAALFGLLEPHAWAQAAGEGSGDAPAGAPPAAPNDGAPPADADSDPEPAAPPAPPPTKPEGGFTSGLYPIAGDAEVPIGWMPPGSSHSPVPSDEIFPPQTITIRFNHKHHIQTVEQTCKVCHAEAYKSQSSADRLLPDPTLTCDGCHDVDHSNLSAVKAGTDKNGQCWWCHLGDDAGKDNRVAPVVIPRPNLKFPHKKHLDRNIECAQCHGQIDKLELATRDNLPRMAGCFRCHNMPPPSQGEAKSECTTCHLTLPTGKLTTDFASGPLQPPQWLHAAAHTADWIDRHRSVAANDSGFCGSCHDSNFCTDCHDGKVRPRNVHPNDWISMHAQAARQDNPRCVSCHQLTSFCGDCHRRVGVARDAPSGNRASGRRFHAAPAVWTTGPRAPGHHAWEAQRNLNACVACHTERDCATCHATKGLSGGAGVNPHPAGFESKCSLAFKRNPRPCLVCHQSGDASLGRCQ